MLAFPKPPTRKKVKSLRSRREQDSHRRVYAAVTKRDGGRCRVCGSTDQTERHHLIGRGSTTTEDVCLLFRRCHAAVHPIIGGKTLRVYGNANDALTVERRTVDGGWQFEGFR